MQRYDDRSDDRRRNDQSPDSGEMGRRGRASQNDPHAGEWNPSGQYAPQGYGSDWRQSSSGSSGGTGEQYGRSGNQNWRGSQGQQYDPDERWQSEQGPGQQGFGRQGYDRRGSEQGGGSFGSENRFQGQYGVQRQYGSGGQGHYGNAGQGQYGSGQWAGNQYGGGSSGWSGSGQQDDDSRQGRFGQSGSGQHGGFGQQGGYGQQSGYGQPVFSYTEIWMIQGPHTGRGPRGYRRSDERIREDVCERLTQHGQIDASDIDIDVRDGEVTLRGMADSRQTRRLAEEAIEDIPGVRDVTNQIRVRQGSDRHGSDRGYGAGYQTGQSYQTGEQSRMGMGTGTGTSGMASSGMASSSMSSSSMGSAGTGMGASQTGAGERAQLRRGMDVAGSDGKRIGQVKEIRDNDFLLERSMARDVYVPFAALTRVTMDRATLNVVGDSIDDLHWQSPSRPGEPDWSIPGSSSSASGSSGSTSMTSAAGASGAGTAGQTMGRPSTSTQPTTGQSASQRQAATAGTASAATTGSGYRYGQAMASDPRYQGRRWEDVQSDLKSGYPTWARQQGAGSENDERAWEHLHEEVRRAWEESRR